MHTALALLCVAYGLIALALLLLYRRWQAVFLVLLPLSSSLLVMASLSIFSVPLNLFHILASFLLLGLGMDYSIFAYAGGEGESTQRAFGITLLLGSSFNLLLAPMITVLAKKTRTVQS